MWQISVIEVRKTHKSSAQYLKIMPGQKYTETWGVNTTIVKMLMAAKI